MEIARLVNDEDNSCIFEVQRKELWIHVRPTLLISVRERLLEFFLT